MPSYGYNTGGSGGSSNQNSWSNSASGGNSSALSMANSFNRSSGESSSDSGSAWSPDQINRINALYPGLLKDYQDAKQVDPWSTYLQQAGPQTPFDPLTAFKPIDTNPIWGEPAIQGRMNSIQAQAAQGAAGQNNLTRSKVAAAGFGGNSPLAQELMTNTSNIARAKGMDTAENFGFNAAKENASHVLAAQTALGQQTAAENAARLARNEGIAHANLGVSTLAGNLKGQQLQYNANRQNALLQALAYYNQPLSFARSRSSQSSSGGSVSSSRSNSSNYSNQSSGSNSSSDQSSWNGGENWAWG